MKRSLLFILISLASISFKSYVMEFTDVKEFTDEEVAHTRLAIDNIRKKVDLYKEKLKKLRTIMHNALQKNTDLNQIIVLDRYDELIHLLKNLKDAQPSGYLKVELLAAENAAQNQDILRLFQELFGEDAFASFIPKHQELLTIKNQILKD